MQLSEHFSLREATYSPTAARLGISNEPDAEALKRMLFTASKMELVREILENRPISVTSWYRGPRLNKAIGGVPGSQHTRGEAVDFISGYGTPKHICKALIDSKHILMYDQIILEPTWVHISFVPTNPRLAELTKTKHGYSMGISV